jgi:hypothetical protein
MANKKPATRRRKPRKPKLPGPLICTKCHQKTLVKDASKKRPWFVCANLLCPGNARLLRRIGNTIIV